MLTIKKGKHKMTVSNGAYKMYFKDAGWEVDFQEEVVEDLDQTNNQELDDDLEDDDIEGEGSEEDDIEDDEPEEEIEDDDIEEEDSEEQSLPVDLSKMNFLQLKSFAESNGIDMSGVENKKTSYIEKIEAVLSYK